MKKIIFMRGLGGRTEAANLLLAGLNPDVNTVRSDLVGHYLYGTGKSSFASCRNPFKSFMMNDREFIIIDNPNQNRPDWMRFMKMADDFKSMRSKFIGVQVGEGHSQDFIRDMSIVIQMGIDDVQSVIGTILDGQSTGFH